MSKILRIGDPHVKPSNIPECEKIMGMALYLAKQHSVDRIEILGDLFHTHAILRLEVLNFWNRWLDRMPVETVILVGNHDKTGDHSSDSHALEVFHEMQNVIIVDEPTRRGIYGYLPYQHSVEDYMQGVRQLASANAKVLVCHQTLGGAQYENGFYAPDSIDPAGIPFDLIISGHIHKRQIIKAGDKTIIYPGTPKWDTLSDANEAKGLTIYEHDDKTGEILSTEFFSTKDVARPIVSLVWKYGDEMPPVLPDPDSNVSLTVELVGPSQWIAEKKDFLKGLASIKSKITDSKMTTRSTGNGLLSFMENIFDTSLDRQMLVKFMKEEGLV